MVTWGSLIAVIIVSTLILYVLTSCMIPTHTELHARVRSYEIYKTGDKYYICLVSDPITFCRWQYYKYTDKDGYTCDNIRYYTKAEIDEFIQQRS